ncbi:MAG: 2-C-methyl-D-erythritol 4-phosphate cytidylyltransferase [Xanthomonadales bacterium]|nr:2-C-methyl-D-erythritol 4-phosphate cytidylyltransferase [Xanthomonadales bacterium]
MTWVVVPAAGRGLRARAVANVDAANAGLDDLPKQYQPLAGKPMLQWTLERLLGHPAITGVMVALAADDRHWPGWQQLLGKPVLTTTGADDRAGSVRAGLTALAALPLPVAAEDWVLVHDAARPCVSASEIDDLFRLGRDDEVGALLALPVTDSLKQADDHGRSLANLPRERAWRALTPQLFRLGELAAALDQARAEGAVITDEASAFERLGRHPRLVPGSANNIKVTRAEDFALAQWLLARL